jgi:hypothetical protein
MSARARGFIAHWHPRADTLALLDQVQGVLAEYSHQRSPALRQIFYRLVGAHGLYVNRLTGAGVNWALVHAHTTSDPGKVTNESEIMPDAFNAAGKQSAVPGR